MQPLTAAPVPTYQAAYSSLGAAYDPQVKTIQASEVPALSALDQAKVNAFRDITNAANAKGMLFSGFTPDQEATYTGTKYLPAVANLKTSIANAVNKLNAERVTQAQDIVTKGQQAANDAAYKNMQLALSQQRNSIAASKVGSGGLTPKQTLDVQNAAQMHADTVKLSAALARHAGPDGFVDPQTYKAGLREWNAAGYTTAQYNNFFKGFVNPNNSKYKNYYGI